MTFPFETYPPRGTTCRDCGAPAERKWAAHWLCKDCWLDMKDKYADETPDVPEREEEE
jgi:hypothetical protein